MDEFIEPSPEDLQDIHWYNIPELDEKEITKKSVFFNSLFDNTGQRLGSPVFVYLGNGQIEFLEDLVHSARSIQRLNEIGLSIYLFEPLCFRMDNLERHNQQWYSEFEPRENMSLICDELESIKTYVTKNGLVNVVVYSCDYNCEKFFTNYTGFFSLSYYDLFVNNLIFERVELEKVELEKRFICLNWRYTKHRHILASYLADKESYVSWYFHVQKGDLEKNLWFDIDKWKIDQPSFYDRIIDNQDLLNNLNFELDLDGVSKTRYCRGPEDFIFWPDQNMYSPFQAGRKDRHLSYYFNRAFVSVVNETRFAQPTANFSEKVFQAIDHLRPFIVVSGPLTLECLRTYGFETFSEYWDESYDRELCHEQRLIKILRVIDYIDSLEFFHLNMILSNMEEKLLRNKKILENLRNKNCIKNY
jgi:hypothetical protein